MGLVVRRGLFVATLAVALLVVGSVRGAELTREEYVARADAICKAGTAKTIPLINEGFREVKENEVRSAAPKIVRAAKLYDGYRQRVRQLPKPAADAAELTAWQKKLGTQNEFLARAGKALSEDKRVKAQGYFTRFIHYGNLANDIVLGYGFKACLFHRKVE